ncbi:MAG: VOC family protein [Pseudomonadales bacterium]
MNQPNCVISHLAICTANLEHSLRFYIEALGFEVKTPPIEIGPPFDTLLEMRGKRCTVSQLVCDDFKLELISFPGSEITGCAERKAMNQRGMTHLTLFVEDVDAAAARIVEYGGHMHEETRVDSQYGVILFCTDPDGVRLELMKAVS